MNKFYVIGERTCETCHGDAVVMSPVWEDYWDYLDERKRFPVTGSDEKVSWWTNKGYDYDDLPPEEIVCQSCRGEGKIVTRVPLVEAM